MIINNTYFKGEVYIPHAKQSVSDNVTGVALDLKNFRDKYELDCLVRSLGRVLSTEFIAELDDTALDGLLPTAAAKWDDLLNGKTYVDANGDTVTWEGIRRESVIGSGVYDASFLANYVYFFYQENYHDTVGGIGFQMGKSVNSEPTDPTPKVTLAWNNFIANVQGEDCESNIRYFNTRYGLGLSGYGTGNNTGLVPMYKFILDSNELVEDTYEDFNPKAWKSMNQFGI
jgi:hypothetical protein